MYKAMLATAGLYGFMAVLTFGHSAAHRVCQPSLLTCDEQVVVPAFAAAICWPLYWSWEFFA